MVSTHFLSPNSLYHLFPNPNKPLQNPNFSSKFCCSSSSRPNWGSNFDASQRRKFEFEDEFGRREKRRKSWWSDDDDDDDEEEEFGFWKDSSPAIDWFFKIAKAFGWMVPIVLLSTVLDTGPNSLMMALVLPLGQTALSLVMDKLWEDPSSSQNFRPQSRPRSKSKTRSRSRSKGYARKARSRPRPVNGDYSDYKSWEAAKKDGRPDSKFGGWDELDQEVSRSNSFTDEQKQKADAPPRGYSDTDKLSRTLNKDKPLFIRLLIAVFPILGSWTRFLF
ncbi:uncharacterized protein LOC110736725 [Chenopodium quinoa]|uniref:uncharacterized protein LOC110736725 n=1 Tax=Chenopodium quinoa TaxID=63459 RepID=UPI000B770F61|nr:uncharacterized protein LOC110736725 [Chenopodium quinoa]